MRILGKFERMVSPRDRGLEIRQHGIHPAEFRVHYRLPSRSNHDRRMACHFSGDGLETQSKPSETTWALAVE